MTRIADEFLQRCKDAQDDQTEVSRARCNKCGYRFAVSALDVRLLRAQMREGNDGNVLAIVINHETGEATNPVPKDDSALTDAEVIDEMTDVCHACALDEEARFDIYGYLGIDDDATREQLENANMKARKIMRILGSEI